MTTGDLKLSPCARYFWRSHSLMNCSGSQLFEALFLSGTSQIGMAGIATLLESPAIAPQPFGSETGHSDYKPSLARHSICAGPPRRVEQHYQLWAPVLGEVLPFLERLGQIAPPKAELMPGESEVIPEDLPFLGGWLGWLGYDLAWEIERLPWLKDDHLPFPVAFWYEPAEFAVLDHVTQRVWLAADTPKGLDGLSQKILQRTVLGVNATDSDSSPDDDNFSSIYIGEKKDLGEKNLQRSPTWKTDELLFETPQAEFQQAVKKAKAHIRAGDVFQVNHSLRFRARTTMPSWEVYKTLHQINPSPFASYWHTPWGSVVSCSPERLVHLKEGVAQSRPIAGTRPRGNTPAADQQNAQTLLNDTKERAEHIMLVDLERNDLGRVCEWGSVRVDELMVIERYSHVMHLVSNVIGLLPADVSAAQLVAALFPGGTITGCPKVRCMEIIETLEPVRRSLFYGSCGYLDRRGRLDLNILIRTLLITEERAANAEAPDTATVWGQVGAGIVADSDPEREWQESLQKAKAQLLALGLMNKS
ncbi:MAG: chorismate-binding protein [Cyanobacteria bacterium P01_F01_bin.3]